jgi:predicted DNA-binding antitoxin AbrB/MazE fold protein
MATIRAIYENGIFRPLEPVDLPEGSRVQLHNLRVVSVEPGQDFEAIQKFIDEQYKPGHTDTAARHNEHQP